MVVNPPKPQGCPWPHVIPPYLLGTGILMGACHQQTPIHKQIMEKYLQYTGKYLRQWGLHTPQLNTKGRLDFSLGQHIAANILTLLSPPPPILHPTLP